MPRKTTNNTITQSKVESKVVSKVESKIESYDDHLSDEDISDVDEDNSSKNDQQENKLDDTFKQSVVSYIKIDNMIKEYQDNIKELKEKKKTDEENILNFLEKNNTNTVNLQDGKLIRNQSETKMPLKIDIIKDALYEGISKKYIGANETERKEVVSEILELMESKRQTKVRVNLKRTHVKTKK